MPANPILSAVIAAADEGLHPANVIAERDPSRPGRWLIRVDCADFVCNAAAQREIGAPEGVTVSVRSRVPERRALLPAGTSEEVIETWIREVAEVGEARDYARHPRGDQYVTRPIRWAIEFTRLSAEARRTATVFGRTYPVRHKLKAAGLRWSPRSQSWRGPLKTCRELVDSLPGLSLHVQPPHLTTIGGGE